MKSMKVHAPAKINLSLRVVGVRSDGYHELRTIFQSIALHDTLTVRRRSGPFALSCDDPTCPVDDRNLVWRAAERVWHAARRKGPPRDVEVVLVKRIPMQAGLGGGSSDAAAALRALASLWGVSITRWRALAVSLGADVPYFLEGGTTLGLDRGDLLFPLAELPTAWVTIVLPDFGISTAEAFGWWDQRGESLSRASPVRRASAASRSRPGGELVNDLQEPVARRCPQISRIAAALDRAGAFHAAMSGSGSAVFGLFDRRTTALNAARLVERGVRTPVRTLVTRTLNRAAYQRLAGIQPHRIHLPFAPRSPGHS
jgi:4-diphosphocytidyl-2-C-methyl-D-erythritol kinase